MSAQTSHDLSDPGKIQVIQFKVLCGSVSPSCLVTITLLDWLCKSIRLNSAVYLCIMSSELAICAAYHVIGCNNE